MATATDPPTPDFYAYPLAAPASVVLDGHFVVVTWPDGVRLRAFDRWLAENTMDRAIDLATRESVIDPADHRDDLTVERAELDADGAVVVTWGPDGNRSTFHPGWLRHVADGQHRVDAALPTPEPWTADELDQPPTRDGAGLVDHRGAVDHDILDAWLGDAVRCGLARLRNVGTDPDLLAGLGAAIGPVRHTNFGPIWDVKADIEPGSTANTTRRLCPHTDLPTRETPPGFQILQCIANDASGGWSTMTDGLALADHLARHHPDRHDALTTLNWIFFNRGNGIDHRWSGPILDTGNGRGPLTVRAFHPVRGFPDMADADLPRAYDALRCFATLANEPRFKLTYPFRPGDLVIFDNRRILHGRDRYDTDGLAGGHRHLRGIYIDHDEVHSHLRVASRRRPKERTNA